jgi:transposase
VAGVVARDADRTSCTPTRATTIVAAGASAGPAASHPGSRDGAFESSQHLGRHRWIVERTLAWLARFRRLTIRYERRVDLHLAFTTLACVLICWAQLSRLCL